MPHTPTAGKAWEYEWTHVEMQPDGEWVDVTYDNTEGTDPYESWIEETEEGRWTIHGPAVEVNRLDLPVSTIDQYSATVPRVGEVVRLYPTELLVEEDTDRVMRFWLFESHAELRPFILLRDLVPTGGEELDLSIRARFLAGSNEEFELYPPHAAGWPLEEDNQAFDGFLRSGLGTSTGQGTRLSRVQGWAQYVPHATLYDSEETGKPEWRGEWQVVSMAAELVAKVEIITADIASHASGDAELHYPSLVGHGDETSGGTGYEIELFNDSDHPLIVGQTLKAYFSRPLYTWLPLQSESVRHFACLYNGNGWTNTKGAAGVGSWTSETVSVKTCDYDDSTTAAGAAFDVKTIPRPNVDTALFSPATANHSGIASIIEWAYAPNGDKVIVSDIWDKPIGRVLWEAVDILNIRDGWHLCDGSATTVDLRNRFIMCVDTAGGAEADENNIGDTGGFRDHGAGTNDHSDHVHDNNHVTGSGVDFDADDPPILEYLAHSDHAHSETDNRPRFYVLAAIQRVS
jgi:hypothetical protein